MSAPARGPDFEIRSADWLGWEEARERILEALEPGPTERVALSAALGRALAEAVEATATLPPWDNSAMDGYAVRGEDVASASPSHPVVLDVASETRAGDVPPPPLEPGQAARIMTGAPVPPGADSVIRVEHTDGEDTPGRISVLRSSDVGRNIRPGGQDMVPGDRVLEAGQTVRPGVVGVLAALGRADLLVHRRPSVGVVSTGNELRPADRYEDVVAGAGVPESNGPMIAAAARAAGGEPELLPIAPDDAEILEDHLLRAAEHDVIVTIGGASMGEADLVKRVLDGLGFEQDFWRVRMRPGSPFSFGFLPRDGRRIPVFGLPGNPASAFVTFELFVRPALLRLGGHRAFHRPTLRVRAGEDLPGARGKTFFVRVTLGGVGTPRAVRTGPQGSGLVRGLAAVQGLAVVPEEVDGIAEGEEVEVLLLTDTREDPTWAALHGG